MESKLPVQIQTAQIDSNSQSSSRRTVSVKSENKKQTRVEKTAVDLKPSPKRESVKNSTPIIRKLKIPDRTL